MNKLQEICAYKSIEVAARKQVMSDLAISELVAAQSAPRGFKSAIDSKAESGFALIAEVKKASPSKGLIRADFDPPEHARAYETGGAACLSVLTDAKYFQGHEDYLLAARAACSLPCLRKDFMIDPWQVAEARALGADAILIIMAALDDVLANELESAAMDFGMDVLTETHNADEFERALKLKSRLIGVNNRNLKDFTVDFARTFELVSSAPADCTFVAESGLTSHADLIAMAEHGVRCFLVGEALMRQNDVAAATKMLLTGQ
jgi:indole-3-glycerol phosphate synthase